MSIEYLEDLATKIDRGETFFACPTNQQSHWRISRNREDLRGIAQRTAEICRCPTSIYRLVNPLMATAGEDYLAVRKILDPGPKGEPNFQWVLVGTREAAELIRDVSRGPTPYFGVVVEETFSPK